MVFTRHAKFYSGTPVEYGDLGVDWTEVLALSTDVDSIFVFNAFDAAVVVRMPQEDSLVEVVLPAGCSFAVDGSSNGMKISAGTISVKGGVALPTTGIFSVIAVG